VYWFRLRTSYGEGAYLMGAFHPLNYLYVAALWLVILYLWWG